MSGKRDQVPAPPAPRLPDLVHAGTIGIRDDLQDRPVLFLSHWVWADPHGRRGRLPSGSSIETGMASCGGRSVAQLHEAAHGPGCKCPVGDFTPHLQVAGEEEREYAHDEPLPYHPEMWKEACW